MTTSLEDALFAAAKAGYVDDITDLLSTNVDWNIRDEFGCTPLHYASQLGHVKAVEVMLNGRGIDINPSDSRGETPLHKAAVKNTKGAVDVITLLVNVGAALEARNHEGKTPFDICINGAKTILSPPVEGWNPDAFDEDSDNKEGSGDDSNNDDDDE